VIGIYEYFQFRKVQRGVLFSAKQDSCVVLMENWKVHADSIASEQRYVEVVEVASPWRPWERPTRLLTILFDRPPLDSVREGALEAISMPWGRINVISAEHMEKEGYSQSTIAAARRGASALDGRISFFFSSISSLDAVKHLGKNKDECLAYANEA